MKPRLLLIIGCAMSLSSLAGAAPLIDLVENDSAIVISVDNAPELIKKWNASPNAACWNDPAVAKFFAPLREKLKVSEWDEKAKAETGFTLADILGLLKGQVVISVGDASTLMKINEGGSPSLAIIAEIGKEQAAVEKLLSIEKKSSQEDETTEDFEGAVLHLRKSAKGETHEERPSWCIVQDVLVSAYPQQKLRTMVTALKKGRVELPITAMEGFKSMKKHAPDSPFLAYVNFEGIYPALHQMASEKFALKKGDGPRNPVTPDPEAIFKALGMDAIRSLYVAYRIDAEGMSSQAGLTYSENRGILKLLAFADGPAPKPAFVTPKWVAVSSSTFSFKTAFFALEDLLAEASPAVSGMVEGQIQQLGKNLGIDLKRDFIGAIGNETVSGYTMTEGQSMETPPPFDELTQIVAFSMSNADKFGTSLQALLSLGGPATAQMFKKTEYKGQTLYSFEAPAPTKNPPPNSAGAKFAYAITPQYFFLSLKSAHALETIIDDQGASHATLWDVPEVKRALAKAPAGACALSYQDLRVTLPGAVAMVSKLARQQPPPSSLKNGESDSKKTASPASYIRSVINPDAEPDAAVWRKYVSSVAGYTVREPDGLYFYGYAENPR